MKQWLYNLESTRLGGTGAMSGLRRWLILRQEPVLLRHLLSRQGLRQVGNIGALANADRVSEAIDVRKERGSRPVVRSGEVPSHPLLDRCRDDEGAERNRGR